MLLLVAPTVLTFAFIVAMGWRFGARRGFLFVLAALLWLPYITPYPLQAFFRLVKAEDIGLTEVVIILGSISVLLRRQGRVTPEGSGRWLALFVVGGLIALTMATLYEPLQGFTFETGASFFRQACLVSLLLYVGIRRLITDNTTAERSMIFLLIGAVILAAVMLFGARPVAGIGSNTDLSGRYLLPFGIIMSVGGNSGAIYFFMMCLLAGSLFLNGKSGATRVFGLLCWGITLYVSMALGTRAVWLVALPMQLLVGLLGAVYCEVPLRRVATALVLVAVVTASLFSFGAMQTDYLRGQIDSLRNGPVGDVQSVQLRADQYGLLAPIVAANPLGTGFLEVFPLDIRQPHSLILKLALTTGILGLIAYYVFILLTLYRCLRLMNRIDIQYRWMLVGVTTIIVFLIVLSPGYDILGRFNFHATFVFVCAVVSAIQVRSRAVRVGVRSKIVSPWGRAACQRHAFVTEG